MRALACPASLKGVLAAPLPRPPSARGLRDGRGRSRELPVADGGEGTAEALRLALGGEWHEADVHDAFGRPRVRAGSCFRTAPRSSRRRPRSRSIRSASTRSRRRAAASASSSAAVLARRAGGAPARARRNGDDGCRRRFARGRPGAAGPGAGRLRRDGHARRGAARSSGRRKAPGRRRSRSSSGASPRARSLCCSTQARRRRCGRARRGARVARRGARAGRGARARRRRLRCLAATTSSSPARGASTPTTTLGKAPGEVADGRSAAARAASSSAAWWTSRCRASRRSRSPAIRLGRRTTSSSWDET